MKLAQETATRNSKKFPATQRKNQPNCAGTPPNWQHCCCTASQGCQVVISKKGQIILKKSK